MLDDHRRADLYAALAPGLAGRPDARPGADQRADNAPVRIHASVRQDDSIADCCCGKHRQLESRNLILDKVNASTGDLALGMVSSRVRSPVFADWFRQPAAGSRFVIAALDEDLQRRLGAKQKAVLLSDETLAKQKINHPDLAVEEYQLLPEIRSE